MTPAGGAGAPRLFSFCLRRAALKVPFKEKAAQADADCEADDLLLHILNLQDECGAWAAFSV